MKIAVLVSPEKSNECDRFSEVIEKLSFFKAKILMDERYRSLFCFPQVEYCPQEEMFCQCDAAIALGGDGTILHCATHAALFHKPVLGINAGRLGFMAGLEIHELDRLQDLMTGCYSLDERMMLEVLVNGEIRGYALNDAVVSKGSVSRILDLNVQIDGSATAFYRADGVIVSTPTGSTAYALSAGGPVIDPGIRALLLTPICPHSLFDRSIVLRSSSVAEIQANTRSGDLAYLTIDGQPGGELSAKDVVQVRRAAITACLIRIKGSTFHDVLRDKMVNRRI